MASNELRLQLLGGAGLSKGGAPLTGFVSTKAAALLAFLAVMPGPHAREELAGLLWGETPEHDARVSLRVVLTNLRQVVGREYFDSNRKTIAFNREQPYWLDVDAFEAHMLKSTREPDDAADAWRRAAELYRGELLSGMAIPGVPAYDEWLTIQREQLRLLALRALDGLADHAIRTGAQADAIDWLTRLLSIDPWREDAYRRLMTLLALSGRRGDALLQYEKCRRLLDSELGIAPEPETTRLYERILAGELRAETALDVPGAIPRPSIMPAHKRRPPDSRTSFIGREAELAKIVAALAEPGRRLVTLVGPGGAGKTRLALEVIADRRVGYRDGVHFVPLAPARVPAQLVPAIATAAGLRVTGTGNPMDELLRFVRDRELLLVLDNFEQLVSSAPLVNEMLDAAPGLKLLVTSRERLARSAEWLIPINGLPVPPETAGADIELSHAVRLFVERARQVEPDFALSGANSAQVVRICRLLDGIPLAIELAAAWTRTHTCAEIEAGITGNLDFLTARTRDLPERHQSLRAVFRHSWELLDAPAQAIIQALAVFQGSFRQDAARAVAAAAPADLLQLVDKSLLHREQSGRFALHELVRQYAAEQLDGSPDALPAQARHAAYYAGRLQAAEPVLRGRDVHATVRDIHADIDDIRAAWRWAADHQQHALLAQALDGLQMYVDITGRLREGIELLHQALDGIERSPAGARGRDPERDALRGRLLGWLARQTMSSGRIAEAASLMQQSLAVLEPLGRSREIVLGLDTQAMLANARGRQDEALRLQQAALADAERRGDLIGKALACRGLGGIAFDTGKLADAGVWFRRGLRVRQDMRDWDSVARELHRVAEVARLLGNFGAARRLNEEGLAIQREVGNSQRMPLLLLQRGELDLDRGRLAEAERHLGTARELAEQRGAMRQLARITGGLALVAARRGALEDGQALVEEALAIARETGDLLMVMGCLQVRAQLAAQAGDLQRAESAGVEALSMAASAGNLYHVGRAKTILGNVAIAQRDLARRAPARQRR